MPFSNYLEFTREHYVVYHTSKLGQANRPPGGLIIGHSDTGAQFLGTPS